MRWMTAAMIVLLGMGASVSHAATATSTSATPAWQVSLPPGDFVTLCFHDIVASEAEARAHPYAITTHRLAAWFDWMRAHGWHPVSVQQIVDAHDGGPALPGNAVLLSFDDGLRSTYTQVYPLLKAYGYPAMFAIETGWLRRVRGDKDVPVSTGAESANQRADERSAARSSNLREPGKVDYNGTELDEDGFVSWAQLREMQDSGLVELATHTDNLHHGIAANPQGNVEPAAITRLYRRADARYESEAEFQQRIRDDLMRSMDIIGKHTGVRPRAVVWPYGAATPQVQEIARSLGLSLSFSLADREVSNPADLHDLGRLLVMGDPDPVAIETQIEQAVTPPRQAQRAVQVDLDDIYDPDPAQANRNLGKLLDRIKAMHVRTVYLQAFADPDGDGTASALYFPNRFMPMRADLFNRVAWQLKTRAQVQVYAWLPLLAFDLPDRARQRRLDVKARAADGSMRPATPGNGRRLSPFLPGALRIVEGIYTDLARNSSGIDGVLISDDAMLTESEGASSCLPQARWPGTDRPITHCRLDARQKTMALIDFSQAVTGPMRRYVNVSNPFHVARNLYARVVMDPAAESRFAQALDPFLAHYDEVALMAMPYLDGTRKRPSAWMHDLVRRVAAHPGAMDKVIFELQTRDWRGKGRWIAGDTLRGWMRQLIRAGAVNLAYYPDDFLAGKPSFQPTFEGISLTDFPHGQGGR